MAAISPSHYAQPTALLPLLFPALVAVIFSYIIYNRFFHPLSSIPGPFTASFTRLWLARHAWNGDMNTTMILLHAQHGPLIRTGPNEVSVSDLTAVKTIYAPGTKFYKSNWYSVWQGHRKFDLFAERNEKIHGEQRRLVSRAYSMEALKDLEPHVDEAVRVFLEKMGEKQGGVVNMGNWVQLFAFGKNGSSLRELSI